MIGASRDSVCRVEGEMKEISEAEMVEAIKFAHEAIKVQIDAQERLRAAVGSPAYREYEPENKWGTIEGAIEDLESLRDCIYETSEHIPIEHLWIRW